jgi:hypothetical protein
VRNFVFAALAVLGVVLGTAGLAAFHPAHAEPPDPCVDTGEEW